MLYYTTLQHSVLYYTRLYFTRLYYAILYCMVSAEISAARVFVTAAGVRVFAFFSVGFS